MSVSVGEEVAQELALREGVCSRPLLREVLDTETKRVERVTLPCGSTWATVCAGHASAAMTMDLYGHLFDHNLWAAAERVGSTTGASQPSAAGNAEAPVEGLGL